MSILKNVQFTPEELKLVDEKHTEICRLGMRAAMVNLLASMLIANACLGLEEATDRQLSADFFADDVIDFVHQIIDRTGESKLTDDTIL